LWRRVLKGETTEPLAAAPAARLIVVFDDVAQRVVALAMDTGREVWGKAVGGIGEFRAVSPDGKTQVFYTNDRAYLAPLPDLRSEPLDWSAGLPEAQFTPNGQRVVLVAALRLVEEDQQHQWYRVARPSQVFTVFDAPTRQVVSTIAPRSTTSKSALQPAP
jgi:hypothetical protein